jgi:hypothetical protein
MSFEQENFFRNRFGPVVQVHFFLCKSFNDPWTDPFYGDPKLQQPMLIIFFAHEG